MSEEEILEKLKNIISEQLGVEKESVTEGATFVDDLSADSLDIVELVMSIEEEEAEDISTVGDVIKYIKENK